MARIGIDARFYGSLGKGLGRYTQKLIEHLEQQDQENQYVIFLRKENFDQYLPYNKNFTKILADYPWYTFAEQLLFPKLIEKQHLDLMHFPHFNAPLLQRGKFVMTIHDLILIHFPTLRGTTLNPLWYWIKYAAYKLNISLAARRAQSIITVSEFTKQDLLTTYPHLKNKIKVTYEACDGVCRITNQAGQQVLEKYGIIKSYLLYVGNAYPHKNLEKLVEAFEIVRQQNPQLQLALVGKEDYFYARLKKFVRDRNIAGVNFLGFVSDQDLDVIYRYASAYVFPSLYEGFGLPPLEAMAKGCPVVCSKHPCMQEVLADAAWYADATNASKFAKAITEVLDNETLKADLSTKGYAQAKKFSWETMARQTLEIYTTILAKQRKIKNKISEAVK